MYLVTGGAGFIGSHIARRLSAVGEGVRVLDNFSYGNSENLRGLERRIEVIRGDILDPVIMEKAMAGVEVVFHQAALRSVPFSVEHPLLVNRVNVDGTLSVLHAARHAGARRVVFASSSSVYGNEARLPASEDQLPKPISPYGVSKLVGEHYCRVFTELYGLETVSLRYFNVFGPRQDPHSEYAAVIPRFIHRVLSGVPLEVHGDGLQSRDFTYVDNVVEANLLAAKVPQASGGVFNVGQGKAYRLMDLIDLLRRILGCELSWVHTPARSGDIRSTLADVSRAHRIMGFRPVTSFAEGVAKTVEHIAVEFYRLSGESPVREQLASVSA
ncbi:MAG: SDR family oxidoreductase [Deltaproteobacteria bacterium]|nr:SDR family oxidoreductase [Deltaproteobacteria bacterium]